LHTVTAGVTVAALYFERSIIRLGAVPNAVTGFIAAVASSGFFIGRTSGVAKIHRFALYGFLSDCYECQSRARALQAADFSNRSMYLYRDSRLLVVTATVLKFLEVSSKVEVFAARRRVIK
jgi:hypothetical protein